MSILDTAEIRPFLLSSKHYKLAVKNSPRETLITMSLLTDYFHTTNLPFTHQILKNSLPKVLKTECFNDSELPFEVEVKSTEIGHLFEHILLEYLCQVKIKNGHKKASFRGITRWNWMKDTKGTFHIKIDISPEDVVFFQFALKKSMSLINKILISEHKKTKALPN